MNSSNLSSSHSKDKKKNTTDKVQNSKSVITSLGNPIISNSISNKSFIFATKLLDILEESPKLFDETRIQVVQRGVNVIGQLPLKYAGIETLYLSNNNLCNLQGLSQFSKLKILTLTNNNINEMNALVQIATLKHLECLNLSGNPISKHPKYKIFLIPALPQLITLDGKPVNQEMRVACQVQAKQQEQLLDSMLQNYCQIVQLNSFEKKLSLHREMSQKNWKFAKQSQTISNLNHRYFSRLFNFYEGLSENFSKELSEQLLNGILAMFVTLQTQNGGNEEENYQKAFHQMIWQQRIKLAEIDVVLDKKVQSYKTLLSEMNSKYPSENISSNGLSKQESRTPQTRTPVKKTNFQSSEKNKQDYFNDQSSKQQPESKEKKVQRKLSFKNIEKSIQQPMQNQFNNSNEFGSNRSFSSSFPSQSLKQQEQNYYQQEKKLQVRLFEEQEQQDLYSKINASSGISTGTKQNKNYFHTQQNNEFTSLNNKTPLDLLANSEFITQRCTINQNHLRSSSQPGFGYIKQHLLVEQNNEGKKSNEHKISGQSFTAHQKKDKSFEQNSYSPNRRIPQPSQYEESNHKQECCRRLMNSAKESYSSWHEQSQKLTPYRRKNKELEELIGKLTKDVSTRDEQINLLNSMNHQIQQKFNEFCKHNTLNIQKSNREQQQLAAEMVEKSTQNELLEEEMRNLRSEISELLLKTGQLQEVELEKNRIQGEKKQLVQLLDSQQEIERQNELAAEHYSHQVLKKTWNMLRYACQLNIIVRMFACDRTRESNKRLLSRCFQALRRKTLINRYVTVKQKQHSTLRILESLRVWKSNIKFSKKISVFLNNKDRQLTNIAMISWKNLVTDTTKHREQIIKADQFRNQLNLVNAWKSLKINAQAPKLPFRKETALCEQAELFHYSKTKRRFFKSLLTYMKDTVQPKQQKLHKADQFRNLRLLKGSLRALKSSKTESMYKLISVNKYITNKKKLRMRAIFNYLYGEFVLEAREKKERVRLQLAFTKKRLLGKWKAAYSLAQNMKVLSEYGRQFHLKKLTERFFLALVTLRNKTKKQIILSKAIKTKRESQIKRICVLKWFKISVSKRFERIEQENRNIGVLRMVFNGWLGLFRQTLMRQQKMRQIECMQLKTQQIQQRDCFFQWLKISNRILRISTLKKLTAFRNESTLLYADLKQNQVDCNNIDEEKQEIFEKSKELMHQNTLLQQIIAEKNNEINNLERSVEQLEKLDFSKEQMIKELIEKNNEQEEKLEFSDDIIAKQREIQEQKEINLELQNRELQQQIDDLQKQFEVNREEIGRQEIAYRQKTVELLGEDRLKSEQLRQMEEQVGQMENDLVREQDQVNEQKEEIRQLSSRENILKDQLAECVNVIDQLQIINESRTKELCEIINQYQEQIKQTHLDLEQSQGIIKQQSQQIRTLEFQVEMLNEQLNQSTTEFLEKIQKSNQLSAMSQSTCFPDKQFETSQRGKYNNLSNSNVDGVTYQVNQTAVKSQNIIISNVISSGSQINKQNNLFSHSQPTSSKKGFQIMQHSLERQRTQMKHKIQSLTHTIEQALSNSARDCQSYQKDKLFLENQSKQSDIYSKRNLLGQFSQTLYPSQQMTQRVQFTNGTHSASKQSTADKKIKDIKDKISIASDSKNYAQSAQLWFQNNNVSNNGNQSKQLDTSEQVIVTPKMKKSRTRIGFSSFGGTHGFEAMLSQEQQVLPIQMTSVLGSDFGKNMIKPNRIQSKNQHQVDHGYRSQGKFYIQQQSKTTNTEENIGDNVSFSNDTQQHMLKELEKSKSGRNIMKNQMEIRMLHLQENLEKDIQLLKSTNE